MTQNVYPATDPSPVASPAAANIRVDGKYLVVRSGAVLPSVCVKTNEPVSGEEFSERKLFWCSRLVALLLPLNLIVFIVVYYLVRKECDITVGISSAASKRYRNRYAAKVVIFFALLLALVSVLVVNPGPILILLLLLILVSLISLLVGNRPLTARKHVKGEFWITGCSEEFLASIKSGSFPNKRSISDPAAND